MARFHMIMIQESRRHPMTQGCPLFLYVVITAEMEEIAIALARNAHPYYDVYYISSKEINFEELIKKV